MMFILGGMILAMLTVPSVLQWRQYPAVSGYSTRYRMGQAIGQAVVLVAIVAVLVGVGVGVGVVTRDPATLTLLHHVTR